MHIHIHIHNIHVARQQCTTCNNIDECTTCDNIDECTTCNNIYLQQHWCIQALRKAWQRSMYTHARIHNSQRWACSTCDSTDAHKSGGRQDRMALRASQSLGALSSIFAMVLGRAHLKHSSLCAVLIPCSYINTCLYIHICIWFCVVHKRRDPLFVQCSNLCSWWTQTRQMVETIPSFIDSNTEWAIPDAPVCILYPSVCCTRLI